MLFRKKKYSLQNAAAFALLTAYTVSSAEKGGIPMRQINDRYADVDDLIFEEEDGGPSER